MVQVINIKKEYEVLLSFLYPDYSIVDGVHGTRKFITHHDVTSKQERDSLDVYYEDCIFISTRIFDEVWDEDVLKQKCVEYANSRLKNRKRKIEASQESFVVDCINFMYNSVNDDEEEAIGTLFEAFGSVRFPQVFFGLAERIPVKKLIAAMNTFVGKVMHCDDSSALFYKQKASLYQKRIRLNMMKALDDYIVRGTDDSGLSECKFYMDLGSNG